MKKRNFNTGALLRVTMLLGLILSPAWAAPAGKIVAWGSGEFGLTNVPPGDDFVAIAAGRNAGHALALRSDGSLAGWGLNTGIEALGSADIFYGQATVPEGKNFKAIAAGVFHSLALRTDGSLVGWGANEVTGHGEFTGQATVPDGHDFVAIAAGDFHSVALKADGSLVAWGDNSENSGRTNVPPGNDFVAIAAGDWHTMALRRDGSIVSWGEDRYGQVSKTPVGKDFVAIAGGVKFSLALKSDGSMVGWGEAGVQAATPRSGAGFVAISGGYGHSLALKSDGSMVGWGSNVNFDDPARPFYGQAIPRPGTNFIAIVASSFFSLAIERAADLTASIVPAVQLSWPATDTKAYQVHVSSSLAGDWAPIGGLMEGTGGTLSTFFTATNGPRFFKIEETTASPLAWLEGRWKGDAVLTSGFEQYAFELNADTTNRAFSTRLSFSSGAPCVGTLRLLSWAANKAEFRETFAAGSDCSSDTVVFTRLNATTIAYTFSQATPVAETGAGILRKQ